jgi:cell division protein FtsB
VEFLNLLYSRHRRRVAWSVSTVNLRRVIVGLYFLVFVGLSLTSAAFFWQTRAEYNRFRRIEADNQRRLAEAEAKLHEQEQILERLRTDPAYVDKIIRQQLGYARPDQFIFRFEN